MRQTSSTTDGGQMTRTAQSGSGGGALSPAANLRNHAPTFSCASPRPSAISARARSIAASSMASSRSSKIVLGSAMPSNSIESADSKSLTRTPMKRDFTFVHTADIHLDSPLTGLARKDLSLIHISEPTRQAEISYAV